MNDKKRTGERVVYVCAVGEIIYFAHDIICGSNPTIFYWNFVYDVIVMFTVTLCHVMQGYWLVKI